MDQRLSDETVLSQNASPMSGPPEKAPPQPNGRASPSQVFAVSAPSVSLPKGGGAIRGMGEKFIANPVTGTGSLSLPIPLSPGRAGFGPQLSLDYDSGAGNGPFGFGWHMALPSITRKTDKGLPRYDDANDSDTFILSGAEDLVPQFKKDAQGNFVRDKNGRFQYDETPRMVAGVDYLVRRYRPRTEGLFARVERWTRRDDGDVHWRSITRDNVTTLYGKRDSEPDGQPVASRIADPSAPERVFSWLICKSYDDKGNASLYSYVPEDSAGIDLTQANEANRSPQSRSANRYLRRIQYGNVTPTLAAGATLSPLGPDLAQMKWLFEVVFDYGEGYVQPLPLDPQQRQFVRASLNAPGTWSVRADPFSHYRSTFEVRTYRRCRRILMWHHFGTELGTPDYLVRSVDFGYEETPIASYLRSATQSGYVRQADGTYLQRSFPPVEFDYSRSPLQDFTVDDFVLQEVDAESLENLPAALGDSHYRWADLDGEGISGILTEQAGAWYYKANLGDGQFGALQTVRPQPSLAALSTGRQELLDLSGEGQLDLVDFSGPVTGFYERNRDGGWEPFRTFRRLPRLAWQDPNLRLVDLTGDGHADVLITEDEVLTWYPSLAEAGFGPGIRLQVPLDEDRGPRLILADPTQCVYLADMSGDGLSDLVRINQGEACYWPNLGYGHFGAKVTMDNSPWFDYSDQFDHRRIHLADTDGNGVADIIYDGETGIQIYLNQSGNSWSSVRQLTSLPLTGTLTSLSTIDLQGTGTTCLVWSSALPGNQQRSLRYIDLMNGVKPHLLTNVVNNLGAETAIQYATSTAFYLADKAAGKPWITRLPFPVHVVERVETLDRVSRNRFVTRYVYHHGFYDGVEREFRGFGMVEQWDTEILAALTDNVDLPPATNIDDASYVPPVWSKSWFHTGIYFGRNRVSNYYAGTGAHPGPGEYYREPALANDPQGAAKLLLDDTTIPDDLTPEEEREACRALRGSLLRQEVYALDSSNKQLHPYTVTEQNFTIEPVQPQGQNRYAVFFSHVRESLSYHYERDPADPRVTHALTLEVDPFGNVLKSAAVGYGRRQPDPDLAPSDQAKQSAVLVTYTEDDFTNVIDDDDDYRTPLPCESRTYELTGLAAATDRSRYTVAMMLPTAPGAAVIPYETTPTPGTVQRRLIEQRRTLFRDNGLNGPLALGVMQSMALPYENYKLAFTPGLVAQVFGGRATNAMLANDGCYVHSQGDANWWVPSGRVFYIAAPAATPAQELTYARQHFFQPCRFRDPFHTAQVNTETFVQYDLYDLLVQETLDPLGNRATVGERNLDPTRALVRSGQDYRVLQPALIMDANRNRSAVAFDALGLVVGSAVMGKPEENLGDSLDGFVTDLTDAVIQEHLTSPIANPQAILSKATTRLVYDLLAYFRSQSQNDPPPAVVYTLARETHVADLAPGQTTKFQHAFSYSDGFGREIQKKNQAEPGPVPQRDPATGRIVVVNGQPKMTANDVAPRWVGSGWTVFNNKGKPVRQYEPFFTDRQSFEFDVRIGVSPVLCYDPVERVVATLHANHTWEKVVLGPWRQDSWDVNDTVLVPDPKADPDVGDFFRLLPDADYLPTWYAQRQSGALGADEQDAANKAAVHAQTPLVAHFDSLGRAFLSVADNKYKRSDTAPSAAPTEELYASRVLLDIEGNQREVRDAIQQSGDIQGRVVMLYDYDVLGNRIHQASMEAGERWTLNDVAGKSLYGWDNRGNQFRTAYDQLRRPAQSFLSNAGGPEALIGLSVYGESQSNPEGANLRGRVYQISDQAGVVTTDQYDFKGNLLHSQRQLAQHYQATLDWSAGVPLEPGAFVSSTLYDALNRPTLLTAPDNSVMRPAYNEAKLLERMDANLGGQQARGQLVWTPFVTNIDYDAKGQRTQIQYGNGAGTTYEYDPFTFRLSHLQTLRGTDVLQDLRYTVDPAGNITHIGDAAQQTIYFRNRRVEPSNDYTYDAIYRLIEATGREHLGQTGGRPNAPTPPNAFDSFNTGLDQPGDGNAMGTYMERYFYDAVGNILTMQHRGTDPTNPGWTRTYSYREASQIEAGKTSNRLSSTAIGATTETYRYDGSAGLHGNITAMPHLPVMQWDYRDQLQATAQQAVSGGGTPEMTWYVYDSGGQRVRKVTQSSATATETPSRTKERIYIGGFEIYREYANDGVTVTLERQTLHIMDDKRRIALVETRTQGDDGSAAQLIRYQFGNNLGSACLELDGQGKIISYEEYHPHGSTSYQAVNKSIKAAAKRYRYTGKERDEENGLYYHGARYYAPWLGRWVQCDPAEFVDGLDLYQYVAGNPTRFSDSTGFGPEEQSLGASMEKASKEHQDAANARRAEKGMDPVQVDRQKGVGGKREVIPDEVKTTPGGTKKVVDTKARHVDSARNQSPSARRADIEANLEQVKNQLAELEKAGTIGSETKGAALRVLHDSDKGASSAEAVAKWREEANAVRNEWVAAAETSAEKALRSRVVVTTTTREAYTAATKNLRPKSPHGSGRAGVVIGVAIAAYILFDTGDAYAAAQSVNPAANTTDLLTSGNITILGAAEAVIKDGVMLTPPGALTMLAWELMQPRGDFYYDERLAKRAIAEGRNPFCAQCHGPGGALDPNNEWNQRAQSRSMRDVMSRFKDADEDAMRAYLK
jgi:RHS repeat-associated protein